MTWLHYQMFVSFIKQINEISQCPKNTRKEGYTAGTTHMGTAIAPHTSPFHHSTVKGQSIVCAV